MQLHPSQIKIRPGLERFRKELGNIEELANSIKSKGQIQPIVINEAYELIAGGRRLAACTLYNMPVEVKIISESDSLAMRELEVEENIQRQDFTPTEYVLAVKELHELKMQINGIPGAVRESSWSIQDTANLIGKDRSSISKDLDLAAIVTAFPSLSSCKTKRELKTAADSLMKLVTRAESLDSYKETLESSDQVKLSNLDAVDFLSQIDDNFTDIFLCDPPYGINIFENALGKGGKTGNSETISGFSYSDSTDESLKLLQNLCTESFRISKPTSHLYMFCGPEFFHLLYSYLKSAGWSPHIKPLIWYKPGQGQANAPEHWPVSCYEMCIYARRENSKLIYARPDVLTYNRIHPSTRIHPSQKPTELLQDLITRSVQPNSILVDPCMGSGSAIVAGLKEKLICLGNDKLLPAYTAAVEFINSELLKKES